MKKLPAIILICLIVSSLFAGCASGTSVSSQPNESTAPIESTAPSGTTPANGNKTEIVYWNQWTQKDEVNFLDKYIGEYNSLQSKYHVSYLAIPFEEYVTTKLSTAFATGEFPDIFECSPAIINQYLDAGVCEPLNDIITADIKSDFTATAFDLMTRNGKIYGIPLDADIVAIYYNKQMLADANVTPPATWEELLAAAVKLNTANHAGYTFEVEKGDWQSFTFYPFVWMQGGTFFKDGKANLNSAEVVKALKLWKDLLDSGGSNETPGRSVSDISILTNGETAMQINGSWSVLRADPEKYGVIPLPTANPGGVTASVMGGWKVMVSAKSGSEEIKGAKDFITWMWLDPEKCAEFNTKAKFSYAPRTSVIKAGSETYRSNDNAIVFSDKVLPNAQSEIALTGEAKEIMGNMIQDALYNMSAQEAADKAQKLMENYLAANPNSFVG